MSIGCARKGGLSSFGWAILVTRFLQEHKYVTVKNAKELEKMKNVQWDIQADKHTRMDNIVEVFLKFMEFVGNIDSFIGDHREITIDGSYKSRDGKSKTIPIYHKGQNIGIWNDECKKKDLVYAAKATAAELNKHNPYNWRAEEGNYMNPNNLFDSSNTQYRKYQAYDASDSSCGIMHKAKMYHG